MAPPHSIANSEDEIDIFGGGFSNFSQVVQFSRVKLEAKEGIFIVSANLPRSVSPNHWR